MTVFTRRDWLRLSTLALGAAAAPLRAQGRPLRMLLDGGYTGANAFLLLAADRGYFKDAGVDLTLATGAGAYRTPERMMADGFDVGVGDISALIEAVSRDPARAPVAIYTVANASPAALVVKAGGRIELPFDLTGRTLVGHPADAAVNTFRAFAAHARIDPDDMTVTTTEAAPAALLQDLLGGKCDAVFGDTPALKAAATAAKIDADRQLRFFRYEDLLPDFYGNAVMVRRPLLTEAPQVVRGLLRAMTRGLRDAILQPDAAIEAVATRNPTADRAIERARLQQVLDGEMAHPEGQRIGIGDFDEGRLATHIVQIVEARRLQRVPGILEIVNRDYLPPLNERITSLGR